ncbi:MAG TPA: SRPBCC domain-containing protein [Thermoleophilaceae bacterium]|nr:SRPBCC domain-containing protein [Thermoleophilaceae bacterium]
MDPTTGTEPIVHEVRIRAEPETVFGFFTDPELMVRWKGREATADPRPGGIYRLCFNDRHVVRGEYVEVSPPERVVFTWGWESDDSPVPPGSSTVAVTLRRDGDETVVRLEHSGLPEGEREQHHEGWGYYLGRLAVAGGGGEPGPDRAQAA